MLNTTLLDQKVKEARANGVPESTIQKRNNEIVNGVDAQDYQLPDPTTAPQMGDGSSATTATDVPPVKPYQNIDYGRLRMEQGNDIQADDANGGKNLNQIKSYYDSFQPSPAEIATTQQQQKDMSTQKEEKSTLNDLELFEKNYNNAGVKGFLGAGLIPSGTGLSPNSAAFDAQRNGLTYSLGKVLYGQSSNGLSDKDKAAIESMLPSRSDTPQQAMIKMNNIRAQVANQYGSNPTKSSIPDENLLGEGVQALKDYSAPIRAQLQNMSSGVIANMTSDERQKANDQSLATANSLIAQSQKEQDPTKKRALYDQAQAILQNPSQDAANVAGGFNKEHINDNPFLESLDSAARVVGGADVLANPGALLKGAINPIRHPLQTASNVKNIVKNPIAAGTTFLKNDYADSFGGKLPGASKVAGGIPVNEAVRTPTDTGTTQPPNPQVGTQPATTQPTANGQPAVASQPPTTQSPATGNPNGLSAREQLAKRFATEVAVPNPNSVTQSENTMQEAFAMTRGNDPRTIARELEADIPQAGKVITAHAANLDSKVGMQPLSAPDNTGVLDQIMAEVNKTTPARANPEMATKFQNELQGLLHSGTFGQEGATRGVTDGTTFTKMNDARKYLTSNKSSWFANGQPVGTPTNDQNAMDWAAANAMKRIMGEGDSSGVFKQMLDRQHTALEAAPALAQATLKDDKMNTVGTMVRKGVNAVADRVGLRTVVPRNTNPLPTIDATPPTMANGEAPLAATNVSNAAPMATSNQPLQGAETTLPNNQKIQFDRRTAQGNTQPTKGSQQLLAATSPSYLKKIGRK